MAASERPDRAQMITGIVLRWFSALGLLAMMNCVYKQDIMFGILCCGTFAVFWQVANLAEKESPNAGRD